MLIIQRIIDGLAMGSMYGLIAVSIVFVYKSTQITNFAQGELATIASLAFAFLLSHFQGYYWGFVLLTLAFVFFIGLFFQKFVLQKIDKLNEDASMSQIIITIGLFLILNSLSTFYFGDEIRSVPKIFDTDKFDFYGVLVGSQATVLLAVNFLISLSLGVFFKFTKLGLQFQAMAEDRRLARLRGVNVKSYIGVVWGIGAALSALVGILVSPIIFAFPSMMFNILLLSYTAAVIGGIKSPGGALLGGLIIGVSEKLLSLVSFIGTELVIVAIYFILILFLLFFPRGLFAVSENRKV